MSHLISAIILAKNEEKYIAECIKNLSFCDEILVIDDYSSDKTIEVINKLSDKKVRVIHHSVDNNFSQARNFGLQRAKNEWILFVDSDEIVSEALAFEVSNAVSSWTSGIENEYNGFYIRRIDFMWGRQLRYGETENIKLLRLARKDSGLWEGKIHEKWKIRGRVGTLNNPIIHRPHQKISEFLKEINFYTDIRAKELKSKNINVFFWSIFLYPLGKFLMNYIFKKGFMDGVHGLVFAIIMSFHSFLVRGKLWLLMEE